MSRRTAWPIVAAVTALALAGCGSSGTGAAKTSSSTTSATPSTSSASPTLTSIATMPTKTRAGAPTTSALPPAVPTACAGQLTGSVGSGVTVAGGQTCRIVGAKVEGDVVVPQGGILDMDDVTISGSLVGTGFGAVTVVSGSVGGNVVLKDGQTVTINGLHVKGDLQVQGSQGRVALFGNWIDGSATCSGNTGAPNASGNSVAGAKNDQCAGL